MLEQTQELDHMTKKMLDRQLRVFGKDLQIRQEGFLTRLMKSRIAVLGLSPATTEVAKNLVLKALNVDFFDSGLVDETTVQGNFLMSSEDIGKTVFFLSDEKAKAVEDIFRDMNPIVKIGSHGSVDIDSLGDEGELKLAEYDLWIVDGLSLAQIRGWDSLARKLNKPLFCVVCCGHHAFSYCTLGQGYGVRIVRHKGKPTEYVENAVINSWSLDQCLDFDYFKPNRQINCVFFALMFKQKIEKGENFTDGDILEVLKRFYTSNEYESYLKSVKMMLSNWGVHFCPVNSVLGSIISQEVVGYFEASKEPALNFLTYDSLIGNAEVVKLQTINFIKSDPKKIQS